MSSMHPQQRRNFQTRNKQTSKLSATTAPHIAVIRVVPHLLYTILAIEAAAICFSRSLARFSRDSRVFRRSSLRSWSERVRDAWPDDGDDVYAYFNNDAGGAAVADARVFARTAAAAGRSVSRLR